MRNTRGVSLTLFLLGWMAWSPCRAIVGGIPENQNDWPFLAVVNTGGGVFLTPHHVLTARHVIAETRKVRNRNKTAAVGSWFTGETGTVQQIVLHPDYTVDRRFEIADFDLAIVKLSRPIALPRYGVISRKETQPGMDVRALGRGNSRIRRDFSGYDFLLRSVDLIVADISQFNGPQQFAGRFTKQMIVAGVPEGFHDVAPGDSGSPLMVGKPGMWEIAGITSGTGYFSVPNSPNNYARLNAFRDWIFSSVPTHMAELRIQGPRILEEGATAQLHVVALLNTGDEAPLPALTWTPLTTNISVSATGEIRAISPGLARIQVKGNDLSSAWDIWIQGPASPPWRVATPKRMTAPGLPARALVFAGTNDVPQTTAVWESLTPESLRVTSDGILYPRAAHDAALFRCSIGTWSATGTVAIAPVPTFDSFAAPGLLQTNWLSATTFNCTSERGEPKTLLFPLIPGATCWLKWTAPMPGRYLFETVADTDHAVQLFRGPSLRRLRPVKPNFPENGARKRRQSLDFFSTHTEPVRFSEIQDDVYPLNVGWQMPVQAEAGDTYYLRASGPPLSKAQPYRRQRKGGAVFFAARVRPGYVFTLSGDYALDAAAHRVSLDQSQEFSLPLNFTGTPPPGILRGHFDSLAVFTSHPANPQASLSLQGRSWSADIANGQLRIPIDAKPGLAGLTLTFRLTSSDGGITPPYRVFLFEQEDVESFLRALGNAPTVTQPIFAPPLDEAALPPPPD